jgi:hypothetical protein
MTVAQNLEMQARGHQHVVHGMRAGRNSMRDCLTNFAAYGFPTALACCEDDVTYNANGMVAMGLDLDGRGRFCYVLPQGLHQPENGAGDDTIMNAVRTAGMRLCRRAENTNGMLVNGGYRGQMLYLPIIGHNYAGGGEAANEAALIARQANEVAAGRGAMWMFHILTETPTLAQHITAAGFERLMIASAELVASGAARWATMPDLLDEYETYTAPVHIGQ